ncbi:MAG: putative lipid II flippase FtsW [Nitrospirae bacterium]|nr:putative lipid II flippase FtsW [Nitrospirota bacterium]
MRSPERGGGLDWPLVVAVASLCILGAFMVYSASYFYALKKFEDPSFFFKKQLLWLAVGLISMLAASRIRLETWGRLAAPLLLLSIIMLGLVLTGLGTEVGGGRRWFRLGGFSFQPAELAKFSLILYMAGSLPRKEDSMRSFLKGVLPYLIIGGLCVVLVLAEPDFGMAMTMLGLVLLMVFIAGMRFRYVAMTVLAAAPMAVFLVMKQPYRVKRVVSFLNPWEHYEGSGFQLIQSLLSFMAGGGAGVGLGSGRQKLFFLPEAHTDFLLAVVGEELGLVGVLIVLGLFGLILHRGLQISRRAPDAFTSLLATGLTLLIVFQAILNAGVSVGLLPTKGMPLPFMSYGGTSIWVNLMAAGILLGIGRRSHETVVDRMRGYGGAPVPGIGGRGKIWGSQGRLPGGTQGS